MDGGWPLSDSLGPRLGKSARDLGFAAVRRRETVVPYSGRVPLRSRSSIARREMDRIHCQRDRRTGNLYPGLPANAREVADEVADIERCRHVAQMARGRP